MLETTEQYDYTRTYIMKYIKDLIGKKHIIRTDLLQQVYEDIDTVGYVKNKSKLTFLLNFLNKDYKHEGTNLMLFVTDMKRFKSEQKNTTTTIEKFFC